MSTLDVPTPSRHRAQAALAVVLLLAGLLAFAAPSGADGPAPVNPATYAQGFLVVTEGDARLEANESEGPIAVGGDLSFDQYQIAIHTAGSFKVDPEDAEPTSLLVGGSVDLPASSGVATVEKGWLAIADATGAEAKRQNPNQITVNAPGAAWDANPRVFGQNSWQPLASAFRTSSFDYAGAFAAWRQLGASLSECAANVTLTGANGPEWPWNPGQEGYVQTGPQDGPRYLVLTEAQVKALPAITFRSGYEPTAARPFIITVVADDGTLTGWEPTNITGDTNGYAPYTLWNFAGLTNVQTVGGRQLAGTVLLPDGDLDHTSNGNLVGGVYAKTFTHGGGGSEVHSYPFATTIAGCGTEPTTTTAPTSTTTSSTSTSTSTTSTSTTSTTVAPTTTSTTVAPTTTSTTVAPTTTSTTVAPTTTSTTVAPTTTSTTVAPTTTSTTVAPTTTSTTVAPTTTSTTVAPTTTSTTVAPTTTSTTVAPTTTTVEPSTTTTAEVLPATTVRPDDPDGAEVLGRTQGGGGGAVAARGALPYTGSDEGPITFVAFGLIGAGALLLALSARARRQQG